MSTPALIALGSNLGDRRAHLDAAVAALAQLPGTTVRGVSSYHETEPAGGPDRQGAFLNAAVSLDTTAGPQDLLRALHAIEADAGRVRAERWGARTLDLDLLLFGDQILASPELTVPHPRMAVRRFVLAPSAEVVPAAIDPLTGRSLADLLRNLDRRPSLVALSGFPDPVRGELFARLVAGLSAEGLGGSEGRPDAPFEARLERLAAAWDAGRWLAADRPDPDRWIVADHWLDDLFRQARSNLDAPRWPAFHSRFLEVRAKALGPTFVIAGPDSPALHGRSPAGTPILEAGLALGSGTAGPGLDLDAIVAEALAACAASRAG